jgi:DNA-directed RNA polymerase specialized sigma24 family protein
VRRSPLPRRADDVLVKGVLDGDPGALDELFDAWFPRAWAHVRAAGCPARDAERLVEAAFVDAIAGLAQRRVGRSFGAHLLACLRAAERRLGRTAPTRTEGA